MSNEFDRAGNQAMEDPFAGVDFAELERSLIDHERCSASS